jgi:hypothetical protein
VLLLNECLLLLFISLSTQSGNFWIHPHTLVHSGFSFIEISKYHLGLWLSFYNCRCRYIFIANTVGVISEIELLWFHICARFLLPYKCKAVYINMSYFSSDSGKGIFNIISHNSE